MGSFRSIVSGKKLRGGSAVSGPGKSKGKTSTSKRRPMNFKRRSSTSSEEVCRRVCSRLPVHVPVVVISSTYGTTVISSGRTSDLSEAGMAVITAATLAPGQNVSIEFTIPASNQKMKMQAVVRHKEQNLYGFEFAAPSVAQRTQIQKFAIA